ncbi:MAG: hypothetical protein KDH94_05695 [Coxiellaceae bacterium]|nr:hypothetical protein [Coxiellaceae bacterium]
MRNRISNWLKQNTVLFGNPSFDASDSLPGELLGGASLRHRFRAAFAKTFAADGFDHHAKTYFGNSKTYSDSGRLQEDRYSPQYYFERFVLKPSLNNPAVSFFGATGLRGGWKAFYLIKVPFTTLVNTVRLVTEFPLYLAESAFRHLFIQSRLSWDEQSRGRHSAIGGGLNAGFGKTILAGFGIGLGAVGYYLFKSARLLTRVVTAPVESAQAGWRVHPIFGVASAVLSIGIYTVASALLLPVALPVVAVKASALFAGAASVLTSAISAAAIGLQLSLIKMRNNIHTYLLKEPPSPKLDEGLSDESSVTEGFGYEDNATIQMSNESSVLRRRSVNETKHERLTPDANRDPRLAASFLKTLGLMPRPKPKAPKEESTQQLNVQRSGFGTDL